MTLGAETVSLRERVGVVGLWLAFVWLTTHWYSWQRTIDLLFGSDMKEYERIARAAPHFPHHALPSQHAARFVPHYLIGLISDALGVGDRTVYYAAAIVLLLALLVVVDRTIAPLGLSLGVYALCMGALVANPYLYRYLAICPARLADSVFLIGGSLAFVGLVRRSGWLLVGGLVVATLGRSEAVVPLVFLAPLGVALSPEWRALAARTRLIVGSLAFAAPVITYAVIRIVDSSFSVRDHPGFMGLTIFGALRDLPGSAHTIAAAWARAGGGVAGVAGILIGLAILRLRGRQRPRIPFAFWAALVAGLSISLEAIVLNPIWLNGSEPLLSALGTALYVVAAAVLATSASLRIAPAVALVASAGLVLTSLHHRFAAISPVSTPGAYAALAFVGLLIVAAAVGWGLPRRAYRESTVPAPSSSER